MNLFKKILVNTLILMVIMLPVRNLSAISSTPSSVISSDHCKGMAVVMAEHAEHQVSSVILDETKPQNKNNTSCVCCKHCDGDCNGCVHVSAIAFEYFQLSSQATAELINDISVVSLTRTVSPPSRPPLVL
ncbi:MAG: hypothetical protein OEZ15_08085 [Gammaproteobacteria bacterium]|nr:hypothetical protein [Gammaproteobacteria bacterium]